MNGQAEIHNPKSEINRQALRVLLVAEGSGGHLIPAFEVAAVLAAQHVAVLLLYADRPQTAPLMQELMQEADRQGIQLSPVPVSRPPAWWPRPLWRCSQAVRVWWIVRRHLRAFRPDAVAGFGGWFCVPAVLAARVHRLPLLLHEQNVRLGRANRFLRHHVDQMALSFERTCRELNGTPRVVTGLPIRRTIGTVPREEAAQRFGLDPRTPTLVVLGGSQGSRAVNRLVCRMLEGLTEEERASWQLIHLTGSADHAAIGQRYAELGVKGLVMPHTARMAAVYAMADVVIARAGASTIAELAQCGTPAVLIPYPYANGHQRDNARLVESVSGAVWLEEHVATPAQLRLAVRRILQDERVRRRMADQIHTLARPDATQRLVEAILAMVSERSESNHAQR